MLSDRSHQGGARGWTWLVSSGSPHVCERARYSHPLGEVGQGGTKHSEQLRNAVRHLAILCGLAAIA